MITDKQLEVLISLLEMPSPSGFEMDAQRLWAKEMAEFAPQVECDAYGNTWATIPAAIPDAPTLMIEAHADEIGFMVRHITKDGFLRVERVGGTDVAIARGRRVRFSGKKGDVMGITGNTAIHIRDDEGKVPKLWELYVDVGANSAKEVEKLGLRIGNVGVYYDGPVLLNDSRLVCRALDNRLSGFILLLLAHRLADRAMKTKKPAVAKGKKASTIALPIRPAWNIILANTVQEEVGCVGAGMLTYRLKPQAGICIDVTHAIDTPGLDAGRFGDIRLGKGPCLAHGTANHPLMVDRLEKAATTKKIPLQHEAVGRSTGTNADSIYKSRIGVPAALISIPLRYMHSPVETADLDDVKNVVTLLEAFIFSLTAQDSFNHKL